MSDTLDLLLSIASSAVRVATPLVLAATGETIAERAGVIDVGVEGIMLGGALAAFLATHATGSALVGVGAALATGLALAALFAGLVLWLRADQVVSGLGLNLLAFGAAGTAYRFALEAYRHAAPDRAVDVRLPELGTWGLPLLDRIPGIGPALFVQEPIAWLALGLVLATAWVLGRSSWGVALRAVGDEPRAAAGAGVSVWRVRALAVLVGGAFARQGRSRGTLLRRGRGARVERPGSRDRDRWLPARARQGASAGDPVRAHAARTRSAAKGPARRDPGRARCPVRGPHLEPRRLGAAARSSRHSRI